jgi:hypothetical protein
MNGSQLSQISTAGYCPVYIPLYYGVGGPATIGSDGSLIGWLDFTGAASNSVSPNSLLTWFCKAGAISRYDSGFTNQTMPLVSAYNSSAADLLSFSSGTVILNGGDLTAPITNAVTIATNTITVDPSATNRLTLSIVRNNGEVFGSFVGPGNTTNSIYSIILQNTTNVVDGYFIGPTGQGGSFTLFGD